MTNETVQNAEQVAKYITTNYCSSETYALFLVNKHSDEIARAKESQSFVYFIGDMIADEAELEPKELEDEEISYEEDKDD